VKLNPRPFNWAAAVLAFVTAVLSAVDGQEALTVVLWILVAATNVLLAVDGGRRR
jgi:hypothetical protein